MKISVERTGGIAALTRVWTVTADTERAKNQWQPHRRGMPLGRGTQDRPGSSSGSGGQPAGQIHLRHPGRAAARGPAGAECHRTVEGARRQHTGRVGRRRLNRSLQLAAEGPAVRLRARVKHFGKVVPEQDRMTEA